VRKADLLRWIMGATLVAFMVYAPFLYYRYTLEHAKRLRPITEGRIYRSGCLSADGFRDAIHKLGIKTVISFWDEDPDPELHANRFSSGTIKESDLCRSMGVNYQFIFVTLLPYDRADKQSRPEAIDQFLQIMDDENSYPVLIHCKAGLHRTGVMAAIYRMEYEGWSRDDAMRELRSHGFGHFVANTSNDYILQYVMPYQRRDANPKLEIRNSKQIQNTEFQ
jgi:tyrosine-protein phosphatase SIW14